MPNLLMLKGLPGSGKSTYAKKLVDYTRVNMDDLRRMLHDGKWTKHNEKIMQALRRSLVEQLLSSGRNVVVDDTNFSPKHEATMRQVAKSVREDTGMAVSFKVELIDTPLHVCIQQDLKRQHSVGKDVITRMHNQFLRETRGVRVVDPELPHCIIVDIDGTVALMGERSPYDWSSVGEDEPNSPIIELIDDYVEARRSGIGANLIFLSGRDAVCMPETLKWLNTQSGIIYLDYPDVEFELHMRAEGDSRKDSIVKRELYEEHVLGKYNVDFVLDDRNSVVDMWRNELGLTCLQVADGDF